MADWGFLLVLFGGLAAASGLQILTTLVWGAISSSATGRITRYEPRLFTRLFKAALIVFIFSTVFLMVVLFAIFNPSGD
jgi:hypothetical protein